MRFPRIRFLVFIRFGQGRISSEPVSIHPVHNRWRAKEFRVNMPRHTASVWSTYEFGDLGLASWIGRKAPLPDNYLSIRTLRVTELNPETRERLENLNTHVSIMMLKHHDEVDYAYYIGY